MTSWLCFVPGNRGQRRQRVLSARVIFVLFTGTTSTPNHLKVQSFLVLSPNSMSAAPTSVRLSAAHFATKESSPSPSDGSIEGVERRRRRYPRKKSGSSNALENDQEGNSNGSTIDERATGKVSSSDANNSHSSSNNSNNPSLSYYQSLGLDPRNNDALLQYGIDSFLSGQYDRPFREDAPAPLPNLSPQQTVDDALRSLRQLDDPDPSHGAAVLLRFCVPLSRGDRWGLAGTAQEAAVTVATRSTRSTGSATSSAKLTSSSSSSSSYVDSWKQIMRSSITPHMLARSIRSSQDFSGLLDWRRMEVKERREEADADDCDGDEMTEKEFKRSSNSSIIGSNRSDVDAVLYYIDDDDDDGDNDHNNHVDCASSIGKVSYDDETRGKGSKDVIRFHMVRSNGVWLIESAEKLF